MQVLRISDKHTLAAQLLADGELTNNAIAERVGVTYQTLWNWRQHEDFAALVRENLARFRDDVRRRGIATPDRRVKALNDRWMRMQRIIEARADDPEYAEAPGGSTGLLVMTMRQIGSGEDARLVREFAVDVGLLKELREHEKQAAQELGQWTEKHDMTSGGRTVPITTVEVVRPAGIASDED